MKTNDIQIALPASKSLSNRWLVLNYICGDVFRLDNLSDADDTQLLRLLLSQLRTHPRRQYYCANAGSVARFMMALLSVTSGEFTLTGSDRLCQRPMNPLIDALNGMGLDVRSVEKPGSLPVSIHGTVPNRKMVFVDPVESSQFASALLLMGAALPEGISVHLKSRPSSKPYLDMTCQVLAKAGFSITVSSNQRAIIVGPRPKQFPKKVVNIENDWSSASYFFTMAALLPDRRIRLRRLSVESLQGDSVARVLFEELGVKSREVRNPYHRDVSSMVIQGGGEKVALFRHTFIDCPDLFPTFAVACAALGVPAKLLGIKTLRLKESDRIAVLQSELQKMGVRVEVTATEFRIRPSELHITQPVDPHGDHRIAMAFAPLQLLHSELKILTPNVVSKSFPSFWEQFDLVKRNVQ